MFRVTRPLESVEENVARLSNGECFELPFLEYDPTIKSNHVECSSCEVLFNLKNFTCYIDSSYYIFNFFVGKVL